MRNGASKNKSNKDKDHKSLIHFPKVTSSWKEK